MPLAIGGASGSHAGSLVGGIHPSVPEQFRQYLIETDETTLTTALDNARSFPEYQTIIFRLAQIREEHAVSGLMSSGDYQKAKKAFKEVEQRLQDAQEAFERAQGSDGWEPTEKELAAIEQRVFGSTWQARIAESALVAHPEWMALMAAGEQQNKQEVRANNKDEKAKTDLDKKIRILLIKKGPLDAEVRRLRKERKAMDEDVAPAVQMSEDDIEAQKLLLRKRLLGDRVEDEFGVHYTGGEIDYQDALDEYRADRDIDVTVAISEEHIKRSVGEHATERAAVARAEREMEEGHHEMLVHEAALKRAKLRAQQARERQLIFEPQAIDTSFVKGLKERPNQLRAVFVEDSLLRDNIANIAYNPDTKMYELVAEVDAQFSDKDVAKKIGGKATTYDLELPSNYHSWASAEMKGLARQESTVGDVAVTFVPRTPTKGKQAPHSEQGKVTMTGKDPEKLLAALHKTKLAQSVCESVPYDAIYRGDYRYGRVAPLYEPLASGKAALELPDGHMVIHGLTGASHGGGAMKHFENIVSSGGLKSIAERRRQGIMGMTSSPIGDIASGIDMGVPCKIDDHTNFGGSIYFGMNPEILSRRDMWFSDRDFGGGHNRLPEYQKYAKKLGQKDLHEPCPVEGRQQHLKKTGGLARTDNEVYVEGEISWNDVDTLFASADVGPQLQATVSKFQQQGLLPKHIRVAVQGQTPAAVKKKTGKKTKTQTTPSGWTVTADGSVVLVDQVDSGPVVENNWDINDHIKYRARELARTME